MESNIFTYTELDNRQKAKKIRAGEIGSTSTDLIIVKFRFSEKATKISRILSFRLGVKTMRNYIVKFRYCQKAKFEKKIYYF